MADALISNCNKFGLWELVNLLWLKNINKEGMAMLGMKYDMQMAVWERDRVRLMVRGGCLPVRGSKGMEWKYDDDLCVCGEKETEIHVLLECKCYDMVRRRWLRTCDVLEEKERIMDVIK